MTEPQKARLRVVSLMRDPDGLKNEIKNAHVGTCLDDGNEVVLEYEEMQDGERARITLKAA